MRSSRFRKLFWSVLLVFSFIHGVTAFPLKGECAQKLKLNPDPGFEWLNRKLNIWYTGDTDNTYDFMVFFNNKIEETDEVTLISSDTSVAELDLYGNYWVLTNLKPGVVKITCIVKRGTTEYKSSMTMNFVKYKNPFSKVSIGKTNLLSKFKKGPEIEAKLKAGTYNFNYKMKKGYKITRITVFNKDSKNSTSATGTSYKPKDKIKITKLTTSVDITLKVGKNELTLKVDNLSLKK